MPKSIYSTRSACLLENRHDFVEVTYRPVRRLFRATTVLRCRHCTTTRANGS